MSAWDEPLESIALAFLDLEMTGCDPARDRICEIAIHRTLGDREIERFQTLIQPGAPVGESIRVHGIDDSMLGAAPALSEIRHEIARLLDGAIVVGHSIGFDLAFLDAAAQRGEIESIPMQGIDTRGLAQRAFRGGSAALGALARELGLPAPTHRAEPDVIATRALFDLATRILRPRTARDLLLAQDVRGAASLRDDIEAILRGALDNDRAVRLCYRVPGRAPFVDLFDVWTLAPPRVEGFFHDRSVRRALRGDRILWAETTEIASSTNAPAGFHPTITSP